MSEQPEMSPQQLQELGAALRALRDDAVGKVDARLHGHGMDRHSEAGLPRRGEDTDDDAAAEAQRSADVTHLARSAEELAAIDAALARLADGSYGECLDCGDPIDYARLRAYPAAARCASCQEIFEKRQALARTPRG